MRRFPAVRISFVACILMATLVCSQNVYANKLDLTIARFIECTPDGSSCRAHNNAYERFLQEYAFGVSPKLMAPASTLGYSGFHLGIEASIATIPSTGTAQFNGSNYTDARWRIGSGVYGATPPAMFFPTVHIRKGLPWSMEVGSSISYLAQSELVALGGEVKWSLFEGYRTKVRGVLPDIAARGTVNRVMGQQDVDMTLIGVDGSISYPFGIGGMISLSPYAGYQHMWTIVRTEPMIIRQDTAGGSAEFHPSRGGQFDVSNANLSGPDLSRHKLFFGLNFQYELLSITMDWTFGLPSEWDTKMYTALPVAGDNWETVTTKVATQVGYSFGVALQF